MFAKLVKYDFRAVWGLESLLCLISLAAGVLGVGLMRVATGEDARGLALLSAECGLTAVCFCVMGCCLGCLFLQLNRFYKSRFTDEGYLTFTLPVTTHQNLLSGLLTAFIGSFAAVVVMGLSFLILMLFGIRWLDGVRMELLVQVLGESVPLLVEKTGLGNIALFVLMLLVGSVSELLLVMLAITLGAQIARKHKILTAVAAYYGIHLLMSVCSAIWVNLGGMSMMDALTIGGLTFYMTGATVQFLLEGLLAYGAMYWLIHRNLNLN